MNPLDSGAAPSSRSLRHALRTVTIAGCLAMVYVTGTSSPLATEFFRSLGANEIHFGLLSGIPMAVLGLQFAGALAVNHLSRRKPLFMTSLIAGRLMYLPVAALPFLYPQMRPDLMIGLMIAAIALGNALAQFGGPAWFSWMADLV